MSLSYTPTAWYWRADDGRIYSSAAQTIVNDQDAGYVAFLAGGNVATPWPRDNAGVQSNAALLAVIDPYGLALSPADALTAYAAAKRYAKEIGGITVSGIPILTDDRSKQMLMGARIAADADDTFTTQWVAADGTIHSVNAATIIAISNAVLAHVANCFATFATVKAGIDAGTISGRFAIDTAFA